MSTKLIDRKLPDYTKGEELFNMISHIVGAAFGLFALIICVAISAYHHDIVGIVASSIYGTSLILLYTMSSLYHGLTHPFAKRLFQIFDHCAIYFLIAGTYTPVALVAIRSHFPMWGWLIFGLQWVLACIAITLTAIDLRRFQIISMICYIFMGWMIILFYPIIIPSLGANAFTYMLVGGILYTIGAVLYGIGKRKRYMHNVFHVFVLVASFVQFLGIVLYIL